jgi:formamidopyrimidine-DNA glycosylase
MPELPEVETVRKSLSLVMDGEIISDLKVHRRDLRRLVPPNIAKSIIGSMVLRIDRRAKYLEFFLDNGLVVIAHLGMSGRMLIDKQPATTKKVMKHEHLTFLMQNNVVIRFIDPRRFGLVDLCTDEGLNAHPLLSKIGIEPLSDKFDGARLALSLSRRQTSIKTALLDQSVIAGLGNIYVCEALWLAGISPRRRANTVSGGRAEKLSFAIKTVLTDAIAVGGSTLRDHVNPTGETGYFQHQFRVYGREKKPCPNCSNDLKRIRQAGRSSFFCSFCQR